MSGRARSFFGTVLQVAGGIVSGGWGFALLLAGSAASYSGQKKMEREAERRARASINRESIRGNVRGSHESLLMVFGKSRVGGIVCALGTENGPDMGHQYVYIGLAHSVCHAGGCGGIEDIWIDETRVDSAGIDGSGEVTTGDLNGLVKVTHYTGTSTQGADPALTSAGLDYSTAYRRGVAWTLFRLKRPLDAEQFRKAFKFGFPSVSVELKGIRVYDPRLDSTNGGSGAHRYSDPTTWEWVNAGNEIGRNPILCASTYSIMRKLDGGEGLPPSRVIWSSVAAGASKCEESITTPAGSQKRFQCNGVVQSQDDPVVNIQKILDACQGKRVEVGGQYAFHAASWATETVTIDSSWLAGPFELQVLSPIEAGWNAVRTNFNDQSVDYKTLEAPPYTNSAYETEDGGYQQFADLTLPMVSDKYQAQYCSQIRGKRSRMQKVLALKCNAKAYDVQLWETAQANLTAGGQDLSALRWRVAHWAPNGNAVDLVLEQDASTIYDVETFTVPVAGDPPVIGAESGPTPTGLTATPVGDGIHLKWDLPKEYVTSRVVIERSATSGTGFAVIGSVGVSQTFFHDPVVDGATYFYRINTRSKTGTSSLYSLEATATAKIVADGDSARVINAGFEQGDTGWDKDGGAWSIVKDATQRSGAWCAKLPGTGVSISKKLRNTKAVPCDPGELVAVSGYLKSTAGATGTGKVEISWLDASLAELSVSGGNSVTPGTTWRQSNAQAQAPASAAYARMQFSVVSFNSSSSEAWRADDSALNMFISSVDALPDGVTYGRPRQTALTSGEIDMTKAGVINRTADNIAEAATRKWAAESGAQVVTGKDIGILADGATYGRTKLTALTSGEVDLTKAGVLNKSADNIAESGSRKWAAESGADVTAGKSITALADVATEPRFYSYTRTITATGAGTETIPTGARVGIMRGWGGCAAGARTTPIDSSNGGGGGGGGSKKTVSMQSTDWGQSISYNVGPGAAGRSTVGSGANGSATTITSSGLSFTNLNINCNGGNGGTSVAGGTGGTASGGDTNVTGSAGTFLPNNGLGGNHALIDGIRPGKGGDGADAGTSGSGSNGRVSFTWEG